MENLSANTKISQATTTDAGAAAATAIKGVAIDMSGYEGVLFTVPVGTIVTGAATSIKVQESDTSADDSGFQDLAGSNQTLADTADNTTVYVDVVKPLKRYVRLYISRATQNATFGAALALQYGGRKKPAIHGTGVSGELWVSPAEGTA